METDKTEAIAAKIRRDDETVIENAVATLEKAGFLISKPTNEPKECTLADFFRRFPHLKPSGANKRFRHEDAPACEITATGPTGRILKIKPNPSLIAWMQLPKTPGKRIK